MTPTEKKYSKAVGKLFYLKYTDYANWDPVTRRYEVVKGLCMPTAMIKERGVWCYKIEWIGTPLDNWTSSTAGYFMRNAEPYQGLAAESSEKS